MKERGTMRSDARKRHEAVTRAIKELPRFHDSKTPKQTVFEGREVVQFDTTHQATITLQEGKAIQLQAKRRIHRIK